MTANKPMLLINNKHEKFIINPGGGMQKHPELGIIDSSKLSGLKSGDEAVISGEAYIFLHPSIRDMLDTSKRGAQIIMPKDGAEIIMNLGISSGSNVLEIGTGSGYLTIMIASAARPEGHIRSYEINERSVGLANKNIDRAGLSDHVDVIHDDGLNCSDTDSFDAVVIDNPEPWKFLPVIEKALKPGGHFCAYVPSMNQVEATVKSLRKRNFFDIRAQETLLRNIVVGEKGTRPDYQMLGHTGYLCFARFLG